MAAWPPQTRAYVAPYAQRRRSRLKGIRMFRPHAGGSAIMIEHKSLTMRYESANFPYDHTIVRSQKYMRVGACPQEWAPARKRRVNGGRLPVKDIGGCLPAILREQKVQFYNKRFK